MPPVSRGTLVPALVALVALLAATVAGAAPPSVDAEAYLVQNAATGEVLAAHDARERVPIASITKLMTALLAVESGDPDDIVTVTSAAAGVGDRAEGLDGEVGVLGRGVARAVGLDHHHRQAVGDDVVHLASDAGALVLGGSWLIA